MGFSDYQLSHLLGCSESDVRDLRKSLGVTASYGIVDTCAGEFEASTPYYYSCYGAENEAISTDGRKVVVVGSGPIRIGQGVEFDYCSVHASWALRENGVESVSYTHLHAVRRIPALLQ